MRSLRLTALATGAALALSVAFSGPAAAQQLDEQAMAECLQPGQSLVGLTPGPGVLITGDNQTFYDSSEATQALFVQVWGECAPVQWAVQHQAELVAAGGIDPSGAGPGSFAVQDFSPPAPEAIDGQTLADQPLDVQQTFIATWGAGAEERWVTEHNAALLAAGFPVPQDEQAGQ